MNPKTCDGCPFSCSDLAEQVINYGCVPSYCEIMDFKKRQNINWRCHSNEKKLCVGFAIECKEQGLNPNDGPPGSPSKWQLEGTP